jgi:transitional endoplasmic reticulum ATPase
MDGVEDYGNVLVIASTNRPDLLDEALVRPGRFDYMLEVKKATRQGCLKILSIHTRKMPLAGDCNVEDFAPRLEGLSGAQIAFVAREGAYNCLRRSVDVAALIADAPAGEADFRHIRITRWDFEMALRRVKEQ